MTPLERLIWNHNRTGNATTYLLTPSELEDIIEAACAEGYKEAWAEAKSEKCSFC